MSERHEPALPLLEARPDYRTTVIALAVWIAAWFAVGTPEAAVLVGWAVVGCVALAATVGWRYRTRMRLGGTRSWGVVLMLAGGIAVVPLFAVGAADRVPDAVAEQADAATTRSWQVQITGAGKPVRSGASFGAPKYRFKAQLQPEGAPVVLIAPIHDGERASVFPIGALVEVEARVKLTDAGDRAVAVLLSNQAPQLRAPPHPLLQAVSDVRAQLAQAVGGLPEPGNMLVPGLAAGDEQLVSDSLDADMKVSSLTHLTAVSGSNIAIVVACALLFGRLIGMRRAWRLALALPVTALFVLLVTPQGSVIRAAAMALVVLAVGMSGRAVHGMPVLGVAVTVLLLSDPWLSRDYGFALSVAATAGILIGTEPCSRFLERWLPKPVSLLIAVPVVAQIACQPILLLLEPSLPTYGVLANLLAAPAAPIATVFGLITVLAIAIAPPLVEVLCWLTWIPAQWIGIVAEGIARWPAAQIPWPSGLLGALLWVGLVALFVVALSRRPPAWMRRVKPVASLLLVAALVCAAVVFVGRAALRIRDFPADWRIAACDIGQGDAVLVRAAAHTMLIDTGEDAGRLHACLREFGIDYLDVLLLTHFDIDHAGAASDLTIPVGALWAPDTEAARHEATVQRFAHAGVPISFVAAGDRVTIGDLEIEVLWPLREGNRPSSLADNEGSVVLRAVPTASCLTSCLRMLALADSGEWVQRQLPRAQLATDVVKVAHHGSRDQDPETYAATGAQLALISVGADNGYGHPTASALSMLHSAGIASIRTDEYGHLVVAGESDGGPVRVWTPRHPGEGNS